MWCLIINLGAFGVGAVFIFVLFKSHMVDQAINFLYRVRTNPILALSQVRRVLRLGLGLGLGSGSGLGLGVGVGLGVGLGLGLGLGFGFGFGLVPPRRRARGRP